MAAPQIEDEDQPSLRYGSAGQPSLGYGSAGQHSLRYGSAGEHEEEQGRNDSTLQPAFAKASARQALQGKRNALLTAGVSLPVTRWA